MNEGWYVDEREGLFRHRGTCRKHSRAKPSGDQECVLNSAHAFLLVGTGFQAWPSFAESWTELRPGVGWPSLVDLALLKGSLMLRLLARGILLLFPEASSGWAAWFACTWLGSDGPSTSTVLLQPWTAGKTRNRVGAQLLRLGVPC